MITPAGKHVTQEAYTLQKHYPSHPGEAQITEFFPPAKQASIPGHLPDNVAAYFSEAVANVKTGPNAAGAMFRKSIDVALKHIDPDAKGNLVKRIDKAANSGKLTADLAEWAHHVRLEGNDAAHDEDPFTPEEADELHKFTDLMMRYLFTLPGMLQARRSDSTESE